MTGLNENASAPDAEPSEGRSIANDHFQLKVNDGALCSLTFPGDAWPTEYIAPEGGFGHLVLRARPAGQTAWVEGTTCGSTVRVEAEDALIRVKARIRAEDDALKAFEAVMTWRLQGERAELDIALQQQGDTEWEVGDLALALPINDKYVWDGTETSERRVFPHFHIAGHGSFFFWMRPNAEPPWLLMLPREDDALEYWEMEGGEGQLIPHLALHAYFHSAARREVIRANKGSWRQPHTSASLAPGEVLRRAFALYRVYSYEEIRQKRFEQDHPDIEIVPGMTVPAGLHARMAIRLQSGIEALEAEFPEQTRIEDLGAGPDGRRLYQIAFQRLGENRLVLQYGGGRRHVLEFFATEPVATLVAKRARFLATTCRHTGKDDWWRGLISDWNMETGVLLGPEHLDRIKGWREYMATCDDPGLGKPAFLAAKVAEAPDAEQIEALDDYIEHFVWGGLQMTDEESHPFGLYGIPNWKRNRESEDPGPGGRLHIWRIYDYPHIALLYHAMYQAARRYPHLTFALTAEEYLRRAAGTAIAMFTIPMEIRKWSAYETGLYNELIISDLLRDLENEGQPETAAVLRAHWERKVRAFVVERTNLFASEYPFDSTGFESMHALARYALDVVDRVEPEPPCTREQVLDFMERATKANIMCRGYLENAYYLLGSDFRGCGPMAYTLSYMAQMGGWAILEYALFHAEDPFALLRLGYQSTLSAWALMNTGTEASGYGFWYPGLQNDGGAGGGFEPASYGHTWLEQPHGRGSWYYACEIDLGFRGGLWCARTVVADDPLFGLFCFGGVMQQDGETLRVEPQDGVHRRFHAVFADRRLHVELDRDHFDTGTPLELDRALTRLRFVVQPRSSGAHETILQVSGCPARSCHAMAGDGPRQAIAPDPSAAGRFILQMEGAPLTVELALG